MNDQTTGSRRSRWAAAVGLLAAGAVGGAVLAGTVSASASPVTSSQQSVTYDAAASAAAPRGHGGGSPVRGDERSLPNASAAKLRAEALKAVPGGSVSRIETDAGDGAYEAHLTKADGSLVTVKFDQSLRVTKVEAGMGAGDPAPPGRGPGAGAQTPGSASSGSASSTGA